MTEDVLKLVPGDPEFLPSPETLDRFSALLQDTFPFADEVSLVTLEAVELIDSGVEPERVGCPHCEAEIPLDWWREAVEAVHRGNPLEFALPCCGRPTSLNALQYDEPLGFARFVAEVVNPASGRWPADDADERRLRELERIFQVPLRVVRNWV